VWRRYLNSSQDSEADFTPPEPELLAETPHAEDESDVLPASEDLARMGEGEDMEELAVGLDETQKFTISTAKSVLLDVCKRFVESRTGTSDLKAHTLDIGYDPAPSHCRTSCAYVLRTHDNWFYVGETDDIHNRCRRHLRTKVKRHLMTGTWLAYVLLPLEEGGKSFAKLIEKETTVTMRGMGYPLVSDRDARNKNFARPKKT
jgi:predicted GIY-YIG superfamily endonuclease